MAREPEIFTARRKKTGDGAVSARYKKIAEEKPAQARKQTGGAARKAAAGAAEKPAAKAREKAAAKPEARGAEKTTAAQRKKTAAPGRGGGKKDGLIDARMKAGPRSAARRESGRDRRAREKTEKAMRDRRRAVSRGVDMPVVMITLMTVLFEAMGFMLLAVRTEGAVDLRAFSLLAVMAPLAIITALVLPRFLPLDPLIMALTNFLCGVGMVVLYTVTPERAVRQASYYALGLAAMLVVSLAVSRMRRFRGLTMLSMVLGIGALLLPLAFGSWQNGAKNWVELPFLGSFQPSELVKLSLVLSLAYYFSAHRTVLQMMPALLFAGACLLLLMLQRDLGTALIYYAATLVLFYAACGNVPLTIMGLGGGAAAAVLGYRMFAHVKVRVAMWRNPWSDPLDKGYQIIQALLAIGSGGLFGVGLGQGTPEKIPAYYNDFIFAVICEQLGVVFGLLLLAVYLVLILRGVSLITHTRRSFDMLLGCGVLAIFAIQTFMIVAGVIKMIPLTGVTMPFLSYGGSSLLSCLMMTGILHGIAARTKADMEDDILSIKG